MKVAFAFLGMLLLLDIGYLNWRTFAWRPAEIVSTSRQQIVSESCPQACVALIPTPVTIVEPQITSVPVYVPAKRTREYYIPLGSGKTNNSSWESITGVEAVIDTVTYPNPKAIVFEVSMYIPTGNGEVFAKLYNVTDQHDAWRSEVKLSSSTSQRIEANNIVLEKGKKLYRVMMKSTMGYEAVLSSARIKIVLEE